MLGLFIQSLSSRNSPGRHILSPPLYGLRNKDSERLTDSPQVSTNAHNRMSRDLSPVLPGSKAPCSFHWTELSLLHFSTHHALIMWTRTWQTWAYFQLRCFIWSLLPLIPEGLPACFCSLQREWGRKWFMSSFLQSRWNLLEKKVLCGSQEINGAT